MNHGCRFELWCCGWDVICEECGEVEEGGGDCGEVEEGGGGCEEDEARERVVVGPRSCIQC